MFWWIDKTVLWNSYRLSPRDVQRWLLSMTTALRAEMDCQKEKKKRYKKSALLTAASRNVQRLSLDRFSEKQTPCFHTGQFQNRHFQDRCSSVAFSVPAISITMQTVNFRHALTNIQPTIYYSCVTTAGAKVEDAPASWANTCSEIESPRWSTMPPPPDHPNECCSYTAVMIPSSNVAHCPWQVVLKSLPL